VKSAPDGHTFSKRAPVPLPPCTGACRGDRPVWEGPARFGRLPDGTRVIFCSCCMRTLTPVAAIAAPPNIVEGIDKRGSRRYECEACGYDTVVLPDLRSSV
jgi:hypothetical protein